MRPTSALLAMLAAMFVVAGCGQSSPTSNNNTTDPAAQYAGEQGVQNSAASMPDEFESNTYEDGAVAKIDISDFGTASVGASVQAEIDPAAWFRLIRRFDRKYVIEF